MSPIHRLGPHAHPPPDSDSSPTFSYKPLNGNRRQSRFLLPPRLSVSTVRTCSSGQDGRERVSMSVLSRFPPSCHLGKHETNNKDATNVSPIWLNRIQRDADTRELYLKVCHQGEASGQPGSFLVDVQSCREGVELPGPLSPRTLNILHDIMRSGCLSFSELRRAKELGSCHFREEGRHWEQWEPEGFVNQNPGAPLNSPPSDLPKLDQTMELLGMPTPSSFARAFAFLLEVLFPDGRSHWREGAVFM